MNITIENPDATHFIRRYEAGKVTLNTGEYMHSILIHQDRVMPWEADLVTTLSAQAIADIVARKPHLVILGTGAQQVFPDHSVLTPIYESKIGLEIMSTEAACRTYNLLADEGRDVLAALMV